MSEELKAIDFLRAKTITYELSSEELRYSLILYNLIMNLQRENEKLKEQLQQKEDIINKAIEELYIWGEILNLEFQKRMLEILEKSDNQ